jgi:hypothetical protein
LQGVGRSDEYRVVGERWIQQVDERRNKGSYMTEKKKLTKGIAVWRISYSARSNDSQACKQRRADMYWFVGVVPSG